MDPRSGFFSNTKTFQSLRPNLQLPNESQNISITSYVFSLLSNLTPNPDAFIDATSGATLEYPTLIHQIHHLAVNLRARGLTKGDIAFVVAPTLVEIPVLYLALLSIGVVVAPSSPALTKREIERQVHLVDPTIAFVTSTTANLIPPDVNAIILDDKDFQSLLVSSASCLVQEVDVDIRQSDTAVILFSSGTTGSCKAVMETHRNYIAMIAGFHQTRNEAPYVQLLLAPLFHSLGFFMAMKGLALGETTVVMTRPSLPNMLRTVDMHRVTMLVTAPPTVVSMSRLDETMEHDLSSLKIIFCGGAPLQEVVCRRLLSRFPWMSIEQGYGSTESGGISRMMTKEECTRMKSVGKLNQNMQAKIVDPITNETLPIGQHGELLVKGPSVMKGYTGDVEATKSSFDSDGWLRTGDLCYFDDEGYLYIVDRIKELIKYKAYQVPPAELEQLLLSHPDILDVAVAPYPHEEAGQIPMALVVKKPKGNISESEIINFVAKHVAPYKKIRKVSFVESIPKSPSGKILRRELAMLVVPSCFTSRL